MNTALKFDKTRVKSLRPIPYAKEREETWNKTMKLYDDGKYIESILATIDYANPTIRQKFGDSSQTHFQVPHGSAVVNITIDNGTLKVHTPFLKLPADAKIPLMRRVSEINFSTLSLPQVYLKNDELYFYYQNPVEMCYPYKVYDIFREICVNADFFDDEFVTQYGAMRIAEPKVFPVEAAQKELAWQKFGEYLAEATQYIQYMESKRMDGFIWDILSIELRKIEYFAAPQGKLRNDIESAVKDLNNNNIQFNERLSSGRRFLAQMQAITKEAFMADQYMTEVFIPYKYYTRIENLKENFGHTIERAGKEMNSGDYMGASLTMQYDMMNLFYNYDLTPDMSDFVEKVMTEASGKEWKEASSILYNAIQNFIKNANTESLVKKGGVSSFLSKALDSFQK